jgi:hypothetical protein
MHEQNNYRGISKITPLTHFTKSTEPCFLNVPSSKCIHPSPKLKQQRKENHKVIVTTAMQAVGQSDMDMHDSNAMLDA